MIVTYTFYSDTRFCVRNVTDMPEYIGHSAKVYAVKNRDNPWFKIK